MDKSNEPKKIRYDYICKKKQCITPCHLCVYETSEPDFPTKCPWHNKAEWEIK